jgi:hypothetical protein
MSLKLKLTPAETLVLYDVVTLLDHAKDLPEDHPLVSESTLGNVRRKLRFLIEKTLTTNESSGDEKKPPFVNCGNLNKDKLDQWLKLQHEKLASLNDVGYQFPDKKLSADVDVVLDDLQARPDYPKNFVRRDKKRRGR